MTETRTQSWQQMVIKADPDFHKDARILPEYEFSKPRGGYRTFYADYQRRHPYVDAPTYAYTDANYLVYADETGAQYVDTTFT